MSLSRKIMFLGAGNSQVPAIDRLRRSGCRLITVDNVPDNPGHRLATQAVNCSTTDREGVLQAARDLSIDGIMTFASDAATSAVAYVAERLQLPGCRVEVARTMSDKALFRSFQQKAGLPHPVFKVLKATDSPQQVLPDFADKLVVKPVDSSGSRGISVVSASDLVAFSRSLHHAFSHSRSKRVCAEEFLPGIDVSGDGFLVDGELRSVVTEKHKQGLVPLGHRLPSMLPLETQSKIEQQVEAHCRALGYLNGPLDFDVKVCAEEIFVIEMSPRLGGNGIPFLIERGSGIDLITATANYAVGNACDLPQKIAVKQGCGSWILGSPCSGRLLGIAPGDVMREAVPEIFDYQIYCDLNQKIEAMDNSSKALGWVLFDCASKEHYLAVTRKIKAALNLRVA